MTLKPPTPTDKAREQNFERVNGQLAKILYTQYRDQWDRVMDAGFGDVDHDFIGFVDVYEALAKVIDRHWTIVDLGCAYAPQAYFFRGHAKYVGVDLPGHRDGTALPRFTFENTEHHVLRIEDYIKGLDTTDLRCTFAICNAVPPGDNSKASQLVRATFTNLFVMYPASPKSF